MQRYQREHFWDAIVWPLLWPLLLVQAALVVLCLMVGAMVWWMTPSHASWSTTLWLMSALLVGSSLNAGAFLMLVKARARRKDNRLSQELNELERHSQVLFQALCQEPFQKLFPNAHDDSLLPCQRLASINEMLVRIEHCLQGAQGGSAVSKNTKHEHEQTLLDDFQHQQQQLKHLMAGRERAREESRLKTGYLTLLQRETDGLLDHLNVMAGKEATDNGRQNVTEVHERLLDIRSLLANLVQQSAESTEKPTEKSREKSTEKLTEENISQGGTDAQRNLRILVVDDGPVNLMLARQMLETQGLQVEGVSSGEQALERQQGALFDLVFMDIFMPTLDGLETTRRWREYERHQGGSQSVLVALTANADDARLDACLAAGMDDLLAKPYQPETLLNIITRWFPGTAKAFPPA
ncbi:response regulator [Vreelandella sulfidaeris]|uniref:Response regulator n=1 Tax=Vreelandella sulfidaeris TaxID=115553 RepID=A0A365TV82_9GAMM|nr:response regulator [Halomonas sulfidaeris]RBI69682.1 response regulator [Halomonas sulfidaeris]